MDACIVVIEFTGILKGHGVASATGVVEKDELQPALPHRLKQDRCSGGGDVEGFDGGVQWDADAIVAGVDDFSARTTAFIAKDEECGLPPIVVIVREFGFASGDNGLETTGAAGCDGAKAGDIGQDGETKGGTHRAAQCFGREGIGGTREGENAVYARGFGGADEGAEIAGVLDAVEAEDEGRSSCKQAIH